MNLTVIIAVAEVLYLCALASAVTGYFVAGRPLWLGLAIVTWLLICFFCGAAAGDPVTQVYAAIRLAIVAVLVTLLGFGLARVRRLERGEG